FLLRAAVPPPGRKDANLAEERNRLNLSWLRCGVRNANTKSKERTHCWMGRLDGLNSEVQLRHVPFPQPDQIVASTPRRIARSRPPPGFRRRSRSSGCG